MALALKILLGGIGVISILVALVWFGNLGGIKERIFVNQIVKMRVSPERLSNPKTPQDYGMAYTDTNIITPDGVRLSAWEIPAPSSSDKTIIMNHALGTTRYGAVEGLDGVPVEYLPMVKHLHDAGYNVVMYDHRGQGDSDGGTGKTLIGTEAPVGVGATEWQDVIGSLEYVRSHPEFGDDQIAFLSQCMGASATFKAWSEAPETFSDPKIRSVVAIQPPIAYEMNKVNSPWFCRRLFSNSLHEKRLIASVFGDLLPEGHRTQVTAKGVHSAVRACELGCAMAVRRLCCKLVTRLPRLHLCAVR